MTSRSVVVRVKAARPSRSAVVDLATVVAVILFGISLGMVAASPAHGAPEPVANVAPVWMVTPCDQEDSSDCYWDASVAGNGIGHSFYAVTIGSQVCRFYWAPRDVRFNACEPNPYA